MDVQLAVALQLQECSQPSGFMFVAALQLLATAQCWNCVTHLHDCSGPWQHSTVCFQL